MKKTSRYYTWSHNVEGCLRNGSYCRVDGERVVQYMNGDYMGEVKAVPAGMSEVPTDQAKRLLPKCCK